jgi:hypothetical protein
MGPARPLQLLALMNRARLPMALAFAALLTPPLACGGSTASSADGGGPPGNDAGMSGSCTTGQQTVCLDAPFSDHICGDSTITISCEGGRFQCPAGTILQSECWCSALGGCGPGMARGACTPSGWSCEPLVDASVDADAATAVCHGSCPQPNGSACASDCDCFNKCLHGTCADPTHPKIPCGSGTGCPSPQTCSPDITSCVGASCSSSDDCPPQQQCTAQGCQFYGCI